MKEKERSRGRSAIRKSFILNEPMREGWLDSALQNTQLHMYLTREAINEANSPVLHHFHPQIGSSEKRKKEKKKKRKEKEESASSHIIRRDHG